MPPIDPVSPLETPRGHVEIRDDVAISIQQAVIVATDNAVPIGRSTLQRWAKHWADQGSAAPVKSVLVTNRDGKFYRLDRLDFEAWLLDQAPDAQPPETPRDPARSHETPRDPVRPSEVSQDPKRPPETSQQSAADTATLRDEIMQLKIDLEVRKQLLTEAVKQSQQHRDKIEMLLRENGALGWRLLQLEPPPPPKNEQEPSATDHARGESQPQRMPHTVVVENLHNRPETAA